MAKMYEGPATLIVEGEETEVLVEVAITTYGGLKEWHGSFQPETDDLAWKAFNASSVVLRIEDGEAPIVVQGGDSSGGAVQFQGSGRPPF